MSLKILHFADLHLGVETYGRLNPETGFSSRLDDFLRVFDEVVDYALNSQIDLVLFCGDAYKNREPTQTLQREFARRINRLATNGIPIFLLAGNHDLPNTVNRATAIEIFHTLSLRNVYIANKPEVHRIPLRSGTLQIASLPWPKRNALLAKEETRELSLEAINHKMEEVLTGVITDLAGRLDPAIPSILAAHVWIQTARVGSENAMLLGNEHMLLLSNVANPAFDYVALGHIHKAQALCDSPPTVYSGSLERLDFGDRDDDKGFYVVEIQPESGKAGRRVSFQFHPVSARRFVTASVNVEQEDIDPTATVIKAVQANGNFRDAIVRLQISLPAALENQLRDSDIRNALKDAYHLTIAREVKREARLRLGSSSAGEITPLEALKTYLESKSPTPSPDQLKQLLEYGEKLIRESTGS